MSELGQKSGMLLDADLPSAPLGLDLDQSSDWWRDAGMSVASTYRIEDVEAEWRKLERFGIDSPMQSLDFTKCWLEHFNVAPEDQLFVTGSAHGRVVALLPLLRRVRHGVSIWTWIPGAHVGSNAPLLDRDLISEMDDNAVADLWHRMFKSMFGADAVVLHSMPIEPERDIYAQLGEHIEWDVLYRSVFENWEDCANTQLTRSRRKHDRQQGAKLAAMGNVEFSVVSQDAEPALIDRIISTMFTQKAQRFAEWGVEDPFAEDDIRAFYRKVFSAGGALKGEMHTLRLDGALVSTRYNLGHQDRIFAMISSMDDDARLSPGSPGKQNILRAMEHIFSSGYRICDQGAGYSDEKRHWCNEQVQLRTHYVPLTAKGRVGIRGHQFKGYLKREIKNNPKLFKLAKNARALIGKG